jgi:transcriptional regulator with XRE-family HTH domain
MNNETSQILNCLKRLLKAQGITYRALSTSLGISEPSVKRLFASGRLTVERLEQISHLLGYSLAELAKEANAGQQRLDRLTEKQEREVVSDPKLLMVAVCTLNHWTLDEIVALYKLSEPECIKYLLQLDRLRIIDLLPGNRIRLNVARDFDWLPAGPIQRYFRETGMPDFLNDRFGDDDQTLSFVHGMFTDQALAEIQQELRKLRQRFAELHESSLSAPLSKRWGMGLLMAMRRWEPQDFAKLRR